VRYLSLTGCLAITAAVYWSVLLHPDALPQTFIEGHGLTSIKIGIEYAIIATLAVPAILFYRDLNRGVSPDSEALLSAAITSMLSEICFTLYSDAADRYNFLGHIYKAVAYCYIYRAMFVSSVREPFERLLRITADLRDSEARFSTVFHFSPIGIGLGTLDGSMLVANQAWLDLLGYQLDEVVGRTTEGLGIYLRPEDRLEVIATLKACGRVGNLELPFRRKNGDQIVAQYSAEIIRLSGEPLLMVMVTDVTARKAEAVALTRYREIVEQHGDPLVFFDHDERIVIANRAYVTLIGKSTADLQGRTLDQVVGVSYYQAADLRLKAALAGEAQHYPL